MGFYIRKSLSIGPFRLNLSKSGVGVSVGVKGFRVGAGPSGRYVHMGRGGLYYRKTLHSNRSTASFIPEGMRVEEPGNGQTFKFNSTDAVQMVDSSAEDLIEDLNARHGTARLTPIAGCAFLALLLVTYALLVPAWIAIMLGLPALPVCFWLHQRDQVRKTIALIYELDDDMQNLAHHLYGSFEHIMEASHVWCVQSVSEVLDRKYHAGAVANFQRQRITPSFHHPPGITTNIPVANLKLGSNTLYFFPDRILVLSGNGWGAIAYSDVATHFSQMRFIESESLPRDAKVVDHTWQFVNRDGQPDRRFKNNHRLPICLYDHLVFRTKTGLSECIQISRLGTGEPLHNLLASMAQDDSRVVNWREDQTPATVKLLESEIGSLLARKTTGWQYKRFAITMRKEVEHHAELYKKWLNGGSIPLPGFITRTNMLRWMADRLNILSRTLARTSSLFNTEFAEAMQSDDESLVTMQCDRICSELGAIYESLLRWSCECRGVRADPEVATALTELALLSRNAIVEVKAFTALASKTINSAFADEATDEDKEVSLTLSLSAPDSTKLIAMVQKNE